MDHLNKDVKKARKDHLYTNQHSATMGTSMSDEGSSIKLAYTYTISAYIYVLIYSLTTYNNKFGNFSQLMTNVSVFAY